MKGTMGIQFYIVLLALISVAEQEHSFKKVDDGIRELGRYLEKIGSLPKCDFEEIVRSSVLKEIGLLVSYLESSLTTYEEIPDYWLADVKRLISNMRKSFSRPEISVPLDLLHNRSVDEAQEMTQRIVRKFGQLLRWWPDIVESARRLKHEEFNIAQPVPAALGSGIRCDYYVAG